MVVLERPHDPDVAAIEVRVAEEDFNRDIGGCHLDLGVFCF